ncbi:MAG: hypothetical protein J2P40_07870 [Candidatus Dormibacteraeota bacterium]|nr:hypothetical protein [Candidatus Dormibacteraeota bacterium]MBO0761176.1 hypothetical protein [Candidatus Dormibacteraeota bacterium]
MSGRPPPWNWERLQASDLETSWRELTLWVEWLRREYRTWVTLPDCWPLHEALRSELCLFMWWHRRAVELSDDPEDGVRWHGELRQAAEAWSRLATCDHESGSRRRPPDEDRRRAQLSGYLREAMEDWRRRAR